MKWLPSMTAAMLAVGVVLPASASPPGDTSSDDSSPAATETTSSAKTDAGDEEPAGASQAGQSSSKSAGRSVDPEERLDQAEIAFRNAEFERITELLRPTLEPTSQFDNPEREVRARELLGVGYFLTAQRVTDAKKRDNLLEFARTQFLELLRIRPDYELDPMVFPASVVDLFQNVRQQNADELERLRRERQLGSGNAAGSSTPIYIERAYERRPFALNFLPLGIGQFQNGNPVRGGLYAAGQIAAVGTIVTGTLAIESMRNPETGRFDRGEEYLQARAWRQTQWIAAGAFGAIYAASVIDAVLSHQRVGNIEIRTLDEPPPELDDDSGSSSSRRPKPRLQITPNGLRLTW